MLFFLLLTHILSSTAAPPADDPHRRSDDSCNDINNCRTLYGILWGCLVTIFAFTWVSVHPNVPPPHQSAIALFWRKLKMMLIAIIAPEIMVGFAARQFFAARELSEQYSFSKTHGFLFAMGGFVDPSGYVVVTKEQLEDQEMLRAIQNIDAEDIMDKSKGDAFSKGVALVQGLWFTTQCLARVHQHLVVTQLEVATMAFAAMNIFTWILWWNKPLGVERQIVVGAPQPPKELPPRTEMALFDRFLIATFGNSKEEDFSASGFTSVPDFWSLAIAEGEEMALLDHVVRWIISSLSGLIFGAIHCAAWTDDFPTTAERWLWRVSSLAVTSIPFMMITLGLVSARVSDELDSLASTLFLILIFPYVTARLLLIALPFAALRSLPASAFVDVNWSIYIPHL
ncbi:hypothetical protein FB45DRAFT_905695 [Roridomyces roridus]|uniref:Uncharacterized protein n=1 Tax=Roridomyces roridus TaxID=1738132 RepID=A0AAD7C5Y7_9AGAR|nr:hypothetical protein FB45DRAFT_905695 [Roridomyces roridus]